MWYIYFYLWCLRQSLQCTNSKSLAKVWTYGDIVFYLTFPKIMLKAFRCRQMNEIITTKLITQYLVFYFLNCGKNCMHVWHSWTLTSWAKYLQLSYLFFHTSVNYLWCVLWDVSYLSCNLAWMSPIFRFWNIFLRNKHEIKS